MIKFLRLKSLLVLSLLLASSALFAQVTVDEYYQNATGKTGNELKAALHTIIRPHSELPYTSSTEFDVWDALDQADEDPNNSNNVILIYTGRSDVKTHHDTGSGDNDAWNREHIWAKSHGDFGTTPGAGTDIHHLRACDRSVNTSRSNLFYDNGGTAHSEATECKYDEDSWEPRDAVKGDIARMIFYMAVCYEGDNGDPDLELTNDMSYSKDNYTAPYFGKLNTLLQWNQQDPVDDNERNRNEKVYTIQGNRNPFIDHPEWVDEIWTTEVDTQSPVVSELSPANGATDVTTTQNLIITFNEDIKEGTGSVYIKRYDDDSELEKLTIPTARLNFNGGQLKIIPSVKYEEGVKYYVLIDNGAVTDASSNTFDGISNKDTWTYTVAYTAPNLVSFSPENGSTNVSISSDLELTFDKNIQAGNGSISIVSNGSEVMNVLASTGSFNGDMVTIDLPEDLEGSTEYSVLIDENAFVSAQGAAFAGISDQTSWAFTTEVVTGIEDLYREGIPSFYPNPASSEIKLTNIDQVVSIHISNLTGRNIMEIKSPGTRLSIGNLPKGMYFISFITADGHRITKKLLKR